MVTRKHILTFVAALLLSGPLSDRTAAQALVDTFFTWQGYGRTSVCRLRMYPTPHDENYTRTVILDELAQNTGASTIADVRHLVELVGRQHSLEPSEICWIFHWGAFSFEGAGDSSRKELFLRATFRRTRSGSLGAPYWRILTREEVEDLTDRFYP